MNIYSVSSGDHDPNNDYFGFTVAMDAGAYSSIRVYESGGHGVIDYSTTSDFIPVLVRGKLNSTGIVELSASQSSRTGYPNYLSWVPGTSVSALSSSNLLDTGTMKEFTSKGSLNDAVFVTSGELIPSQYYDTAWTPTGYLEIRNVTVPSSPVLGQPLTGLKGSRSTETDLPFISAVNTEIDTTGSFDIFSSTLEGCVFSFTLSRNLSNTSWNRPGSRVLPEKFSAIQTDRVDKLSTLEEWNSIFSINDGCNAGSLFEGGESRDDVFLSEMSNYLDRNWYGKLKTHLWGNAINDSSIALSSRDPELLKRTINYCFLYFGASDDVLSLGKVNYVNPWSYNGVGTQIRWHIGLGGVEPYSNQSRYLKKENTLLATINKYANVNKVFGLPPRTAYSYNLANNVNMVYNTGYMGTDQNIEKDTFEY